MTVKKIIFAVFLSALTGGLSAVNNTAYYSAAGGDRSAYLRNNSPKQSVGDVYRDDESMLIVDTRDSFFWYYKCDSSNDGIVARQNSAGGPVLFRCGGGRWAPLVGDPGGCEPGKKFALVASHPTRIFGGNQTYSFVLHSTGCEPVTFRVGMVVVYPDGTRVPFGQERRCTIDQACQIAAPGAHQLQPGYQITEYRLSGV